MRTDGQEIDLGSAKSSKKKREAQRTISLGLDTLVIQYIYDKMIHCSLHLVMPYSLEVRLVRLIFLQGGIADANFKSCHAIVLGINNSPVEYSLIAL